MTVTLKKKMSGCVPDSRQSGSIRCICNSFLFNNGTVCHLIRSQLEYDGGRAYTDSGHVFILAIGHAHHFPRIIRALYTLRTQPASYIHFANYSINQVCSPARSQLCILQRGVCLETSSFANVMDLLGHCYPTMHM